MTLADDLGLLCIIINGGKDQRIVGRTKLQKIAYFCQYYDWDIGDYKLHHYGPFSFKLAELVEVGCNLDIIKETADTPHVITLTKKGEQFLTSAREYTKTQILRQTTKLACQLSEWDKEDLELTATIDHINKMDNLTKDKLLIKAGHVKNKFEKDRIDDAYNKWEKLIKDIKN